MQNTCKEQYKSLPLLELWFCGKAASGESSVILGNVEAVDVSAVAVPVFK